MNAPTSAIVPSSLSAPATPGFKTAAQIAAEGLAPPKASATAAAPAAASSPAASTPAAPPTDKPKRQKRATAPAAKPKTERKARIAPLTTAEKFAVLKVIEAAKPTDTDADLADRASAQCSRAVAVGLIATYREQLGQKSVKEPTKAEMRARLADMEKQLEALRQPQLFADPVSSAGQQLAVLGTPLPVIDAGNPHAITGSTKAVAVHAAEVPPTATNPLGLASVALLQQERQERGEPDPVDLAEANDQARQREGADQQAEVAA